MPLSFFGGVHAIIFHADLVRCGSGVSVAVGPLCDMCYLSSRADCKLLAPLIDAYAGYNGGVPVFVTIATR